MVLAKSHELLEKRYPNTKISWVEFPAGPQMLEALNVGSIDLGSTGDIPPIFAQAAGADLVYVGAEPPKPKAEVILVPENSPIKTVADLKGHKVAFQKGSSSHNLVLRALQLAGLKFTDIQPTYLTPADARAAFQQGNVDAWAIWDPYYSAALLQGKVRVLTDGSELKQTGSFYLATVPMREKRCLCCRRAGHLQPGRCADHQPAPAKHRAAGENHGSAGGGDCQLSEPSSADGNRPGQRGNRPPPAANRRPLL